MARRAVGRVDESASVALASENLQDPAKLRKLVIDLIGNESWLEMTSDVKGDAYEARADLDEFVACYRPENRNLRKPLWDEKQNPEGRWRVFTYEELVAREKCSLDLFWLKDESLEDSARLPDPHLLAEEIADDLRAALEQVESVLADLQLRAAAIARSEAEG